MRAFLTSNSSFLQLFRRGARPVSPLDHAVAVTQQKLYLDNAFMMATINLVNAIVVALSFFFVAPHWGMICWLAVVFTFTIIGFRTWKLTRAASVPSTSSGGFLTKAELSSLVLGAVWGLPNFYAGSVSQELALFFLLVSSGMASGYTSMVAACPRMTLRFVFGISVPSFFAAVFYLGSFGLAVAALIIVLNLSLAQQAIRSFKQLESLVASRNEAQTARAHLLDAVESIEDAFAIFGEDGKVQMANSRHRQWFPNGFEISAATSGEVKRMSEQTWAMCAILPMKDRRTVCIHKDVSRLKVRESELIAARREAEHANAAKARFMATMSHELRTPLNIINGFSKIMSSSSNVIVSASEMREYSDSVHEAGEHLLTVINDIIEFSQVGSDRYIHEPAPEDVHELLSKAISLSAKFQTINDLSGIDVSVASDVGDLVVDEAAFRRGIMSLLSNAFKFGGQPVRIVVRAFLRSDGCPVISIRDFGPGIEADDLERVFEPFYQASSASMGRFAGTGLGLALARELMRLHGGRVELASRPGVGTTASVILPASAHIPRAAKPHEASPAKGVRAVA